MVQVATQQKIYTVDDIYALPDGERAELIDGQIYYFDPAGGQMINLESLQMPANTDIVS